MSFQPKPPTNPLEAMLRDAAKQMEKKLGEWQAKQRAGTPPPTAAGQADVEKKRADETLRVLTASDGGNAGMRVPPGAGGSGGSGDGKKSALGESSAQKIFKWIIGIGIALWVFGIVKDIVWGIVKEIIHGNSNFNQNGANVLKGVQGFNWESVMSGLFSSLVPIAIFIVAIIFVVKSIRVVPQQRAFVIERLGRYHATLEPGLRFTIPFVDRISAKHDLREVPLDVPSQVCITRDNTQLQVDGVLYYQITDPKLATYGSSNYIAAITQLSQTTLRSVIGKLELDKTFEERDMINHAIVNSLDEAAMNWGVKVLRYEIKDLTPPKEILHAMQAQITAEREKRALIAASEGRKQENF
jgi:hypothetical protein